MPNSQKTCRTAAFMAGWRVTSPGSWMLRLREGVAPKTEPWTDLVQTT
jgi:hypothetical protein